MMTSILLVTRTGFKAIWHQAMHTTAFLLKSFHALNILMLCLHVTCDLRLTNFIYTIYYTVCILGASTVMHTCAGKTGLHSGVSVKQTAGVLQHETKNRWEMLYINLTVMLATYLAEWCSVHVAAAAWLTADDKAWNQLPEWAAADRPVIPSCCQRVQVAWRPTSWQGEWPELQRQQAADQHQLQQCHCSLPEHVTCSTEWLRFYIPLHKNR